MSSSLRSSNKRKKAISVNTKCTGTRLTKTSGTVSPDVNSNSLNNKNNNDGRTSPNPTTEHPARSATPPTPSDNRSTTPISLPSNSGGSIAATTATTATTTTTTTKTKSKSTKKHAEGRWTKDEDTKLRAAVKEMSGKNWKRISELAFTGVRSDVQCLHRWQKVLRPGLHKGPWSKEEDAIVLEVVNRSGGVNSVKWSAVANQVKGRLGKQVRERWYNHLDPMLKKGPWAPQEDVLLLQLQAKMGNRWCEIAKNITGRSENAVKNRWNSAQRRARAQKENKNKDGSGTTSKKPCKSKKRKAPKDSTQTATSGSDGDSSKTKSKKRARTNKGGNNSNNPNGLSVISDIGTALQMCDMVTANSNSPVQSPTRPATPPTRKNETAAHVLAHSFVRISKEDDAASALLDLL